MSELQSPRCQLRHPKLSDLESVVLLESDPDIAKFTSMKVPQTREQSQARLERHISKQKEWDPFGVWIAEDKNTREFVGWFMLVPSDKAEYELGYMALPKYWGLGITTEVCAAILEHATNQGIKKIVARTDHGNQASIRVLEKLKFVEDSAATDTGVKSFVYKI